MIRVNGNITSIDLKEVTGAYDHFQKLHQTRDKLIIGRAKVFLPAPLLPPSKHLCRAIESSADNSSDPRP
jgi:hypothetical protein